MTTRATTLALALAGVAGVAVAAWVVLRPSGSSGASAVAAGPSGSTPVSASAAPSAAALRAPAVRPTLADDEVAADDESPSRAPVHLRADAVVATVDGAPVRGRDLVPFVGGQVEVELTPEMHGFLRERAIDRLITEQAARAQGVELTAAQRRQLDEAAAREPDPARRAFDARDSAAQLLLTALADKAGVASPYPTAADVEAYRVAHAAELAEPAEPSARAAAWPALERTLRERLAGERMAAYQVDLRAFVARLRAAAKIE